MKSEVSPVIIAVVAALLLAVVGFVGYKMMVHPQVTDSNKIVKPPAGMDWQSMQKMQQNNANPNAPANPMGGPVGAVGGPR